MAPGSITFVRGISKVWEPPLNLSNLPDQDHNGDRLPPLKHFFSHCSFVIPLLFFSSNTAYGSTEDKTVIESIRLFEKTDGIGKLEAMEKLTVLLLKGKTTLKNKEKIVEALAKAALDPYEKVQFAAIDFLKLTLSVINLAEGKPVLSADDKVKVDPEKWKKAVKRHERDVTDAREVFPVQSTVHFKKKVVGALEAVLYHWNWNACTRAARALLEGLPKEALSSASKTVLALTLVKDYTGSDFLKKGLKELSELAVKKEISPAKVDQAIDIVIQAGSSWDLSVVHWVRKTLQAFLQAGFFTRERFEKAMLTLARGSNIRAHFAAASNRVTLRVLVELDPILTADFLLHRSQALNEDEKYWIRSDLKSLDLSKLDAAQAEQVRDALK